MNDLEQQVFALELLLALRLASDGPEARARLAQALRDAAPGASETERSIRARAFAILASGEGPRALEH